MFRFSEMDQEERLQLRLILSERYLKYLLQMEEKDTPTDLYSSFQALLALILPKAAVADDHLSNLRYLNDDLADLQRRLVEEHDQPVGKYAEEVGPVLHPDTAISQVVFHLTESRNNLPVVDKDSSKLIGMVSYWDIIGRILGDSQ